MPARLFLRIFGNVDTGSTHHHFIKTVKQLPFSNIRNVLDAGCGKGKFSFWLSQKYPNIHIDACDLSAQNVELCKEIQNSLGTNCRFFVHDLSNFKNPDRYDFIFSNHVLEHITDNETAIGNLVTSLRHGGYIYIQIPNATLSRLFPEKFLRAHSEWEKDEHVGQTLTLGSLSNVLKKSGCNILIEKYVSAFWSQLSFELKETALNYFNSRLLFIILFPALKLFGYMDSMFHHKKGNGILVLAQKK
jgi:SAM-dependent methyltransferase